jgi:G3E family GTPase
MIADIVFGFLGSGKTTFITRILREWGDKEKIVVLVNEFGEVGIDGELLKGQGGNVVEMPSGCICCTLQSDFRSQMLDIIQTINPQRVIIEPTGVATIEQIRSIIEAQMFEKDIESIHNILVADATGFMGLYKANRHFVESQVRNARVVLLNKTDKVDKRKAEVTRNAISAINPKTTVLMTQFGAVDWVQYQLALSTLPESEGKLDATYPHEGHGEVEYTEDGMRLIHLQHEQDALGYESFGCLYGDLSFDQAALEKLFKQLTTPEMGEIVRAKGLFCVGEKWVLMELASGDFSFQPIGPSQESKVSVIGRGLDREMIGSAFERCVSGETN